MARKSNFEELVGVAALLPWYVALLLAAEVPPLNSARGNLVKSVFEKENGLEEAIHRRTNHWFFEAGGSRHAGQGVVPAAWLQ
jgi:hypothetical protein